MRQLLCYAAAAAMAFLALSVDAATVATKKTTPKKKTAIVTKKGATGKKGSPAKKTAQAWRTRQLQPTPERYKEIQDALVAKGFLKPEEAGNGWKQSSVDALKSFQSAQNLEANGKINSLSLIALGLGPKHDSQPAKPVENQP